MNPWRQRVVSANAVRLVCLPYAGGSAAVFRDWEAALEGCCDVRALELPGRGRRMAEVLTRSMSDAVVALIDAIAHVAHRPYAIFGCSLGALVAFELARECRRRGLPGPSRLIVAAAGAPDGWKPARDLDSLSDRDLVAHVARWGGIPPIVRADEDLLRLTVPALRHDLRLAETYQYRCEEPLSCPILAYAGSRDPIAPSEVVGAWRAHTRGGFELHVVPGGHFFLEESRMALLASLAAELVHDPAESREAEHP